VPTYQYVCTECGGQLEAVQKFTDESLTMHEDCGGRLRKVFSPVGIVFKGSGFYKTDSRSSATSSVAKDSSAKDSSAKDGAVKDGAGKDSGAKDASKSGGESSPGSSAGGGTSSPAASSSSASSSGEKVA
jgi:putative FmdB family regulatory protein